MDITEIRIKLMEDPNDRLQAFCSITFDLAFVVRDLKIIHGGKGPFVAMPSRKLTDRCPRCSAKNPLRAAYCNDCGCKLNPDRSMKDPEGRAKLYADIAHPINSECRDTIQRLVIEAYHREVELSKHPEYVCRYDDFGEESVAALHESEEVLDFGAWASRSTPTGHRSHDGERRHVDDRRVAVSPTDRATYAQSDGNVLHIDPAHDSGATGATSGPAASSMDGLVGANVRPLRIVGVPGDENFGAGII